MMTKLSTGNDQMNLFPSFVQFKSWVLRIYQQSGLFYPREGIYLRDPCSYRLPSSVSAMYIGPAGEMSK